MQTLTKHKLDSARHLFVVDAENVVGTPSVTNEAAQQMLRQLEEAFSTFSNAHKVIASSHYAARTSAFAFFGLRQIWRSGVDGADLALINVLANERVEQRFTHVTICSGDGIFADVASWLSSHGVHVTVLVGRGRLSARLALVAHEVVYLVDELSGANYGEAA